MIGNLELVEEVVKIAGPDNLNVLSLIINSHDYIGKTPLFLLCEHGYYDEEKMAIDHENRHKIIQKLIPETAAFDDKNVADWRFTCS
jgi:hypothetical protein